MPSSVMFTVLVGRPLTMAPRELPSAVVVYRKAALDDSCPADTDRYGAESPCKREKYKIIFHACLNADLPAYGLFVSNPLSEPTSARVLATFANGLPAVALNTYGKGEVVLLNWRANQRTTAVGSEIMRRSLQRLLHTGQQIYLLRSETNAKEYGYDSFDSTLEWLTHLGWVPVQVSETDVPDLAVGSVLVMPDVYLISTATAAQLAQFVRDGSGIIFVDGPSRSIELTDIQAITGMTSRGGGSACSYILAMRMSDF